MILNKNDEKRANMTFSISAPGHFKLPLPLHVYFARFSEPPPPLEGIDQMSLMNALFSLEQSDNSANR